MYSNPDSLIEYSLRDVSVGVGPSVLLADIVQDNYTGLVLIKFFIFFLLFVD